MTDNKRASKVFRSSASLCLLIANLGYAYNHCSANPTDLAELKVAWQEYLDDQGESFWGEVSEDWKAFPALKVDVGKQSEHLTRTLVYSPPYLLNKSIWIKDKELVEDFADGGNPDYRYRVS